VSADPYIDRVSPRLVHSLVVRYARSSVRHDYISPLVVRYARSSVRHDYISPASHHIYISNNVACAAVRNIPPPQREIGGSRSTATINFKK